MLSFDAFFKKIFLDTCHNWIIFHVAMQICICWKLQIDSEILTDFLFCHWICRNRIQMINFHNLLVFLVKIKAALQFTHVICFVRRKPKIAQLYNSKTFAFQLLGTYSKELYFVYTKYNPPVLAKSYTTRARELSGRFY